MLAAEGCERRARGPRGTGTWRYRTQGTWECRGRKSRCAVARMVLVGNLAWGGAMRRSGLGLRGKVRAMHTGSPQNAKRLGLHREKISGGLYPGPPPGYNSSHVSWIAVKLRLQLAIVVWHCGTAPSSASVGSGPSAARFRLRRLPLRARLRPLARRPAASSTNSASRICLASSAPSWCRLLGCASGSRSPPLYSFLLTASSPRAILLTDACVIAGRGDCTGRRGLCRLCGPPRSRADGR